MKNLKFLIVGVLLALMLALTALAAETTVYVKDGGSGNGATSSTPVGSLSSAVSALNGKGGRVVLVGDTSISSITTIAEQSGDLTITSQNGAKLLLKSRLQFANNTNSNIITIDTPIDVATSAACYMFGGFNNVIFSENCVMTQSGGGELRFFGGVNAKDATSIDACITELPFSITVENGCFAEFNGGCFRSGADVYIGSIAAPISITINGGTFGDAGDYSEALSPIKSSGADFSVGGMGFLADDVTLTINGGTFNVPIYISGRIGTIHSPAQNISKKLATDAKYYAQDGDVSVTISGGSFNGGAFADTFVDAGYSRLMRGDYTVTISGGSFSEGTVFDATQVKAYKGESKKASITYPEGAGIVAKRFDLVNGEAQSYTEPTRVAFIGDSITEGHSSGTPLLYSYPAQYLALEIAAGNDVIISNLGVSASGMLPSTKYYYPEMLPAPLALYEVDADVFFFALGTNDAASLVSSDSGSADRFYDEYYSFIKACGDAQDTQKVYVSSALFRGRGVSASSMRAANVMRPMQKRIANDLSLIDADKYHFVDLYALTYDEATADILFTSDNLHPHADGYAIMAQDVFNAIHNEVYTVSGFEMEDVYVSAAAPEYGEGTKENPESSLSIAISKCAPEATIHISGTVDMGSTLTVSDNVTSLTILGEGSDAAITATVFATMTLSCDVTFDNIKIISPANDSIMIFGGYNNVTFTESFATEGDVHFYAGKLIRDDMYQVDVYSVNTYDTVESASSDKDATVNILGGTFGALSATNRRFTSYSPYGVYSGNMIFNVGENVTVTDATNSGIVGMNYLAGNIVANIDGWGSATLKDNMRLGSMAGTISYDTSMNTGKLTVNVADGVAENRIVTGDINADGALSVLDVLTALKAVCDGENVNASTHYYEVKSLKLIHVLQILKLIAK